MPDGTRTAHLSSDLSAAGAPSDVVRVVASIAEACRRISLDIRTDPVQTSQEKNAFGDTVLSVDMMAERHISDQLRRCPAVASYVSEECPALTSAPHSGGTFTVSYDPLDGSSVIRANFSVGSIFAVWPGADPIGLRVRDMAASVVAVYGPRVVLFVATRATGALEFFCDGSQWRRRVGSASGPRAPQPQLPLTPLRLRERATVFSPGNLRAAARLPWYRAVLEHYVRAEATLRYTGGMVPDVCQIVVKGDGIYMTPESPGHSVKLRLLFEAAPMAFLIVCAGGSATTGTMDMMDVQVKEIEQRTPIALGCRWDVLHYESLCRAASKL